MKRFIWILRACSALGLAAMLASLILLPETVTAGDTGRALVIFAAGVMGAVYFVATGRSLAP